MSAVLPNSERVPSRKHRRWLRWVGYVAGCLLSLILVLACMGALYEAVASGLGGDRNAPPGRLVDVGGYRMHLYCIGQGSPTVVLDSGLGNSGLAWDKVQPQVGQFTRVCSYDRAGLGWSDASPNPRTSKVFAEELHILLHNAGIATPLVLVGHSMGGYDVRIYATLYPGEAVGMVLVDSAHPDERTRCPPEWARAMAEFNRKVRLVVYSAPFGIPRLMGYCGGLAGTRCRQMFNEVNAELTNQDWESADQARASGSLGDMPLVVLSRDPDDLNNVLPVSGGESQARLKAINQAWDQLQDDLTHLSTNSSRVIAKGSGHVIQEDRPDLVIEAVRKVVERYRAQANPPK